MTRPAIRLRPGGRGDAVALAAILAEPEVRRWWGEPEPARRLAARFRGADGSTLLVIEIDGSVAGGIEYHEELEPDYRHASIDVYLGTAWQDHGAGTEAVRNLARFLFDERGHHRVTIDPAVDNHRAIRCYEKVGFRAVGVMRDYERGPDGAFHDGLLMDLLRGDLAEPSR
jgi:aminoglycoside 6'-N-acetyltransferase